MIQFKVINYYKRDMKKIHISIEQLMFVRNKGVMREYRKREIQWILYLKYR